MYTSNRVFTKCDNVINYNDYYKLKDGTQILKTIKSRDNLAILKQFNSYENFQKMSASYFPLIDNNTVEFSYVKNIYNDNESFIVKEKSIEDEIMCKDTLYPYGKIITKKKVNPQFPTNIELCKWCNQKPNKNIQLNNIEEVMIKNCNSIKSNDNCELLELTNNNKHINGELTKIMENLISEFKERKNTQHEESKLNDNNVDLTKIMEDLIVELKDKKNNVFCNLLDSFDNSPKIIIKKEEIIEEEFKKEEFKKEKIKKEEFKKECNCKKRNNCNLCKNARSLFI
jgi:hypothetical protein